jgi:hypothetical protein
MALGVLLAATLAACGWSAARVAARWTGGGWARVATGSALLGTLALLVPLACGVSGLGASPLALAGVSLTVALVAGLMAGAPGDSAAAEAARRLAAAGPGARAAAAALAAGALAVLVQALVQPEVRTDGYHLAEIVRWLHAGTPGSAELVVQEWPAGEYPLANELALTWGIGIARAFSFAALWSVAAAALLAGSVTALLRLRGLSWPLAGLGAAAVALAVFTVGALEGIATDLPSMAWLACGASLLAAPDPRDRHPGPALLALALATGTKTTAGLPGLVLLLALGWPARRRLSAGDAAAAVAAAVVALTWPVRNLVEHGSPLWPFSSLGVGDPVPYILSELQTSFLDDPAGSLRMYYDFSTGDLATALLLLGGALLVAGLDRTRAVVFPAAMALVTMAVWATSPITGPPPESVGPVAQASIRYGLPALGVAAVAVALATRAGSRARLPAIVTLVLCCAGCLYLLPERAFTGPGGAWAPLLAAGLAAVAAATLGLRVPPRAAAALALVPLAAVAIAVAAGTERYMHPEVGEGARVSRALAWLQEQPAYREGDDPVVATWRPDGRLAGPRLEHPIVLLPTSATCAQVRRSTRRAWLVVTRDRVLRAAARPAPGERCMAGRRPDYRDAFHAVYTELR